MKIPFLAGASVLVFQSLASGQVTVASDDFETGSHPGGDRTVVSGGLNGIRFFTRSATGASYSAAIVNDSGAGGLGSNALRHLDNTTASAGNQIIGLLPTPITLTNSGDYVSFSFTFRFTNTTTATANNAGFRFGLESSNGTAITADGQGGTSDNDQGYYAATGVGTGAPGAGNLFFRESGGTSPILGGVDRTNLTATGAGMAFNDTNPHNVVFTILRGSAGNLALSLAFDGGTAFSTSVAGPYYTFDEIAFGDGFVTNPVAFNIDNISVVTSVPEPSALVGLVLGAVALTSRRSRKA